MTAWLIIQIVATIKHPLNLPEWFDTAIIVLLAIVFPVTLIMSWGFNVTSEGIVRDTGDTEEALVYLRRAPGQSYMDEVNVRLQMNVYADAVLDQTEFVEVRNRLGLRLE